ncbi:MAG: hypothetical protein QOK48_63 [Blastocatellia bacterium]|jgi:hypothetical protein|nr:hypothetical protein [Blastocatellia bacterium]
MIQARPVGRLHLATFGARLRRGPFRFRPRARTGTSAPGVTARQITKKAAEKGTPRPGFEVARAASPREEDAQAARPT